MTPGGRGGRQGLGSPLCFPGRMLCRVNMWTGVASASGSESPCLATGPDVYKQCAWPPGARPHLDGERATCPLLALQGRLAVRHAHRRVPGGVTWVSGCPGVFSVAVVGRAGAPAVRLMLQASHTHTPQTGLVCEGGCWQGSPACPGTQPVPGSDSEA